MTAKTIAMYLPQFHEISENDMWWGKGFTDWITVQNAKTLYTGHHQPNIPLNKNYYDLLERQVIEQQSKLAIKYHIYGFCFYHYWFDKGKKVLEKPVENFLKWKNIEMPFCLCWANQTWARTWSNIKSANAWSEINEVKGDKQDTAILLLQKYGREKLWKEHFDYLLPFFLDRRYIKIQNKPVFLIYKADDIYSLSQMIEYWNILAKSYGLNGIYIIGENSTKSKKIDAIMEHQPASAFMNIDAKLKNEIRTYDYENVWKEILRSAEKKKNNIFYMGFVNFDDTPRRGKKGTVVENVDITLFETYYQSLKQKSEEIGAEYIFLNAWNEWGEGMYLEPDEKNGYAFLEAHSRAVNRKYINTEIKPDCIDKELLKDNNNKNDKFIRYYNLLNQWMYLKENNKNITDYLKENDILKVAVYGYGDLGKHLVKEIENSELEIIYIIDKQKEISSKWKVKEPDDNFDPVDAVIVTAFMDYEEILNNIKKKLKCPVISIEELVLENI